MKAVKMLMMAALIIVSVSLFAQDSPKQKSTTPRQKTEMMKYRCPVHPDVVSNKPGKCSKCGKELTKSNKEKMKMDVKKTYTCPMHPDVTTDKPGKCSKCGMDLKEKEQATVVYSCPMKCEGDKTYEKPGNCPKCGMVLKEIKDAAPITNTNHLNTKQ